MGDSLIQIASLFTLKNNLLVYLENIQL